MGSKQNPNTIPYIGHYNLASKILNKTFLPNCFMHTNKITNITGK